MRENWQFEHLPSLQSNQFLGSHDCYIKWTSILRRSTLLRGSSPSGACDDVRRSCSGTTMAMPGGKLINYTFCCWWNIKRQLWELWQCAARCDIVRPIQDRMFGLPWNVTFFVHASQPTQKVDWVKYIECILCS